MSKETETALKALSNPTLSTYLELMQNTETPAIMHAWALVSAASACLTRRKWFPLGSINVYPNQYVMLVGPPGTRKSAAISFVRQLLDKIDGLRFGPNNTAGRPQGLISAMQGSRSSGEVEEDKMFAEAMDSAGSTLNLGLGVDVDLTSVHALDRHALYCAESELVGFLGRNMDEFITFLGDVWDCPTKHTTSLKREVTTVDFPCLNVIGGITPLHITTYLPPQAIGQGFSSRVIMVYEDESKKVAWPEPIDPKMLGQFQNLMNWIYGMTEGAFELEPEVRAKVIELYDYKFPINDVRFVHYAQRRQSHMLKTAMALAALRMSDVISADDIQDAHDLLTLTEHRMPEALGEYGMSEAAVARARVTYALKNALQPLTALRITLACGSDVKRQEIRRAITELEESNQIIQVKLRDPAGNETIGYAWPRRSNPFERLKQYEVTYLIEEPVDGATRKSTPNKSLADAVRPKQAGPDEDALAKFTDDQESGGENGLAAQGHASVASKLASIIGKQKDRKVVH